MAKKKKTQLRPVVRGFATTSVPKKVSTPELAPDVDNQDNRDGDIGIPLEVGQGTNDVLVAQSQGEGSEEQSLQNLVDRLQEKTEKEITRYLADALTIP
jgi:ATP-dependent RNA helicase DHX29